MHDPTFWQGRRVLVTGHTGFKGSWLSLWLCRLGADVHGVALAPETEPALFNQLGLHTKISRHCLLDINDSNGLAAIVESCQPQVVFHLAAQPLVRRSYRDPLGTWATNVQGSLKLLEALKPLGHPCAVVMVTTDKVYENREWDYGYRENDRIGGHDPYSASKAGAELAIASWRSSFCGSAVHQTPHLAIATARAGNVIGGGDWAEDRIVPDAMCALAIDGPIQVRSPHSERPWQHVLEPLGGYLLLAQKLSASQSTTNGPNLFCSAFNFGPRLEANRSVKELVEEVLKHWPGSWVDVSELEALHEAGRLNLQIDKANHVLGWRPRWDFAQTVARTVGWYRSVHEGADVVECSLCDLNAYGADLTHGN